MALLKIAKAEIFRFCLPFAAPVRIGKTLLSKREGFFIVLTDDEGRQGFGEVAPLPGWDTLSMDACRSECFRLKRMLMPGTLNLDGYDPAVPGLGMWSPPCSCLPHALFGLESAFLHLCVERLWVEGRLSLPLNCGVRVSGLFLPSLDPKRIEALMAVLAQSGVQTIKIKIGRLPLEEEIRQIKVLRDSIGAGAILRFDGNRHLCSDEYACYYSAFSSAPVAYAEEPLRDPDLLASTNVPWPVAVDESLPVYLDRNEANLASLPSGIAFLIVKPGLVAGISGMIRLARMAAEKRMGIVWSSAFNTGVTLVTLAIAARLAGLPAQTAHGLDTLRYLTDDVLETSVGIHRGWLRISRKRVLEGLHLNWRRLTLESS